MQNLSKFLRNIILALLTATAAIGGPVYAIDLPTDPASSQYWVYVFETFELQLAQNGRDAYELARWAIESGKTVTLTSMAAWEAEAAAASSMSTTAPALMEVAQVTFLTTAGTILLAVSPLIVSGAGIYAAYDDPTLLDGQTVQDGTYSGPLLFNQEYSDSGTPVSVLTNKE